MDRTLTAEERELWKGRLLKAEQAYDDLMNGTLAEEFIDQNGERVRYTKTDGTKLQRYIKSIRDLLNPAAARAAAPRPLGFYF